jgi:hypothetical protein
MDGLVERGFRPAHVLKIAGLVVAAFVVVAAAGAAALFLWLRTYTPLDASPVDYVPGPGVGAAIEPAVGSGGKEVFFPSYRGGKPFDAAFTLHNSGHFTVTVLGLVAARAGSPPWIGPVKVLGTSSVSAGADVGRTHPFQPLQLGPGDTGAVVIRFRPACLPNATRAAPVYSDRVTLRYRYLRIFERTQTVVLPFAVTLRCVNNPVANP